MSGYTVIDLETTGFSAAKHHRVLEVGVVHVDPTGRVENAWSTLINPGRDIGNTHVHGITATDIVSAPTFGDIAPALLDSIRGRTIVAHNAPFDLQFLDAELVRIGLKTEELSRPVDWCLAVRPRGCWLGAMYGSPERSTNRPGFQPLCL